MKKQSFPFLFALVVVVVAISGFIATSTLADRSEEWQSESSGGRASYVAETVEEASELAGFELLQTQFEHSTLFQGKIEVSAYGPDRDFSFVRRGWGDPNSDGGIMLFEENVFSLMNGGEPRELAGISGVGQEYPAVGSTPPRMVFSWDELGGTATVFAILDGEVDLELVEKFVTSLGQ